MYAATSILCRPGCPLREAGRVRGSREAEPVGSADWEARSGGCSELSRKKPFSEMGLSWSQ